MVVTFLVVHSTRVTDLLTYRDCTVVVTFLVVHSTRVTDLLTYRDCAVVVVFMVVQCPSNKRRVLQGRIC